MEEEQCSAIVENAWRTAVDVAGENVAGAISRVAVDLTDWSKNILGDLEKRIKRIRKALEECRRGDKNTRQRGSAKIQVVTP